MSERVLARIWIGGKLPRSCSYKLVLAVRRARVSVGVPGFEHITCEPVSIEGLLEATVEGVPHLQDSQAPDGEMPILTSACRQLGLTYRLWHDPTLDDGCRVEVWGPGMDRPLRLLGDKTDPHTHLVESLPVQLAINHLRDGHLDRALALLKRACPAVPEVPELELVEDE